MNLMNLESKSKAKYKLVQLLIMENIIDLKNVHAAE